MESLETKMNGHIFNSLLAMVVEIYTMRRTIKNGGNVYSERITEELNIVGKRSGLIAVF